MTDTLLQTLVDNKTKADATLKELLPESDLMRERVTLARQAVATANAELRAHTVQQEHAKTVQQFQTSENDQRKINAGVKP